MVIIFTTRITKKKNTKVHASFGIFGFSELEESYLKLVEKRFRGYYWKEFTNLFTSARIILPLAIIFLIYQSSVILKDSGTWYLTMIVFLLLSFAWIAFRYWGLHKKYKNYASYFAHNQLYAFMNLGINFCIQGHFFLYRKDEALENILGQAFLGVLTLVISLLFIGILILPRVLDRNISDTEKLIEIYGESEKTK